MLREEPHQKHTASIQATEEIFGSCLMTSGDIASQSLVLLVSHDGAGGTLGNNETPPPPLSFTSLFARQEIIRAREERGVFIINHPAVRPL